MRNIIAQKIARALQPLRFKRPERTLVMARPAQCIPPPAVARKFVPHKPLHLICFFSGWLLFACIMTSCGTVKSSFNPNAEYPKVQLQEDYTMFRDILQDAHPSLYWYTSKDSLDYFFDYGYQHIQDSMTEPQFRTLLSYVISKIDCGHTSVRFSKKYAKYIDTARQPQFPLGIKFWDDSAVVYTNINRFDSVLKGEL